MADYTITATTEQDEALAWVAQQADPPQEPAAYLQARNTDILNDYVRQHAVQTAVAPVDDVAVAYASGTTQQQAQVADILGLQITRPG
jgi:hypothetical protein